MIFHRITGLDVGLNAGLDGKILTTTAILGES